MQDEKIHTAPKGLFGDLFLLSVSPTGHFCIDTKVTKKSFIFSAEMLAPKWHFSLKRLSGHAHIRKPLFAQDALNQ